MTAEERMNIIPKLFAVGIFLAVVCLCTAVGWIAWQAYSWIG